MAVLKRPSVVILAAVFAVALALVFLLPGRSAGSDATLVTQSGRHAIAIELADTPETRETGLMNREDLAEGSGMLFDFGETRPVTMWMKNTLIPLDMLFLDEGGVVTRVAPNAQPLSLALIPSGDPVRYVLELNGGAAAGYGVKAGDRLEHPAVAAGR